MTKRPQKSSARQEIRTKQRGHLRRSTIFALMGVAGVALIGTQIPKMIGASDAMQEKFIAWSAHQGFTVQNVDVVGRKRVPAEFLMQSLNIKRGEPILSYDMAVAQAKLAENPWFKSVNVERRLPETIFVRLQERQPVARWQVNGKLAVVDNEGVVLTTENLDQYKTLPIIVGQEARHKLLDLFALLNAEPDIGRDIAAATWIGNRRWDLTMKSGLVLKLPAEEPGLALSRIAAMNQKDQLFERDIISVDLRLPDRAILQPSGRANAVIERPDFSDMPDLSKKSI